MKLTVSTISKTYDIHIENGLLDKAANYFVEGKKYLIITDDGVPKTYVNKVKKALGNVKVFTFVKGEQSKSFDTYKEIVDFLLVENFSKSDYVIALGGGVVGDLAGYVAATFKRGIKFVNIPTTTLSMVDSSIGGKVAININGVKNVIGTYYHPEFVLIDITVLKTLPKRHIYNGMIEALKTGIIGDKELYNMFLTGEYLENYNEVIYRSLSVKARVVQQDEKETHYRKILNYGHTFGHAYESYFKMGGFLHGEAVALGMLTIAKNESYYEDLRRILKKMNIKSIPSVEEDVMLSYIYNDKKSDGEFIDIVVVKEIGDPEIVRTEIQQLKAYLR